MSFFLPSLFPPPSFCTVMKTYAPMALSVVFVIVPKAISGVTNTA